jgi:hypothetical protein
MFQSQKAQAHWMGYVSEAQLEAMEKSPYSYTGFESERAVFCAGVIPLWEGSGAAWAIIAQECKADFLALHNCVKRFLAVCPLRRIECTVDADFKPGLRWVKALGFACEAPRMRFHRPDGGDSALFARVRE